MLILPEVKSVGLQFKCTPHLFFLQFFSWDYITPCIMKVICCQAPVQLTGLIKDFFPSGIRQAVLKQGVHRQGSASLEMMPIDPLSPPPFLQGSLEGSIRFSASLLGYTYMYIKTSFKLLFECTFLWNQRNCFLVTSQKRVTLLVLRQLVKFQSELCSYYWTESLNKYIMSAQSSYWNQQVTFFISGTL